MRKIYSIILCTLFGAFTMQAQVNIGSYDATTSSLCWTLNGSCMPHAESKLEDPALFGPGGIVDETIDVSHYTIGSLTPAILDNLDVFFIGFVVNGSIPPSEITLLQNWVNNGGRMVITADHETYDDVAEAFGHATTTQGSSSTTPTALGASHPIFDGPFGSAPSYFSGGAIGFFNNTAGADVLSVYAGGEAALLEKEVGAGKILISGDVCTMSSVLSPSGINNNNDIYFANLFAYITEPSCENEIGYCPANVVLWENLPSVIESTDGLLASGLSFGNGTYDLFDSNGNLIADDITTLPDDLILGETYLLKGNDLPAGSACEDGLTEFKVLSLGCTNP